MHCLTLDRGHIPITGPPEVINCGAVAGNFVPWAGTMACVTELALDDVILTECEMPCKAVAAVRPLTVTKGKSFTYTVKFSCPKMKKGARNTAVLTLQLPSGFQLENGKASEATTAVPTANGSNLVTWTIPCAPNTLTLTLRIKANRCIRSPSLEGNFCFGNACQALTLHKEVRATWSCARNAQEGGGCSEMTRGPLNNVHQLPHRALSSLPFPSNSSSLCPSAPKPRRSNRLLHRSDDDGGG
jgi:hypothetical protein